MGFWKSLFGETQQKQETGASREIDADLQNILTRVEKLQPLWTTEHHVQGSVDGPGPLYRDELKSEQIKKDPFSNLEYQEWVLKDSAPWAISMTFIQDTPDGELETCVYSSSYFAFVDVSLKPAGCLAALSYKVEPGSRPTILCGRVAPYGEAKINRAAVQHVREWVRRRVLPELEAAKEERDSALQQRDAKLEAMRKKYLP